MAAATIDYDKLAQQHGGTAAVDYDALAAQHGGNVANAAPPQEGFWHSLGAQFGITPEAAKAALQDEKDHPVKSFLLNLIDPAGVGRGLIGQAKQSAGELGQAYDAAKENNPAAVAQHTITAVPVVGPALAKGADQHAQGDYAGEAGTLLGASAQAAALVLGAADAAVPGRPVIPNPKFPNKPPVSGQNYTPSHAQAFEGAIAPATAMGKNFIPQNITPEALTPIRATAARMAQGTPVEQGTVQAATASSTPPLERLGAYQKIVQGALDDLEQQHAPALAQNAKVPVDTTPIVKELQSQISPTMATADVSAIRQLIMRVRQAQTIGDLNKFRQELNTETSPEYRQSQVQAGRSGISAQTTSDLAGWVRDAYYDALQKATGTDFAPLKRQEANLITTQEALQNQQAPLAKAEATYNAPSTLRETAGNIANVIKEPKTTVTQTILRESPATKVSTLLQKSLADLPPASSSTGVPAPPAPPRGLLDRGPIQMPAPPEAGGTPAGYQPPPFYADTDQMRLGRLLPARSSAPTIPPYVPGMTAGERAAALNHWLRQRQQLALPANAAPIPLPPPR